MLYSTEEINMSHFQKFADVKESALKNRDVKAAYDALELEYTIANSMIKARLAKKLTQEQLATKAGVTQNTIARLESGTNNPTINTVNKVARALGKELRLVGI